MSAQEATRGRGLLAAALTSVADWLVEPAREDELAAADQRQVQTLPRPVVAVAGLRRRTGVTTVARGLGAVLAAADSGGACVVTAAGGGNSIPLGLPAAGRLTRMLAPLVQGSVRACGRLCLVEGGDPVAVCAACREFAPVVLDVAEPAQAAVLASLADHVVLVAGPDAEPALAAVVAESLAVVGPPPAIVLNRSGRAAAGWVGGDHIALPESRLAAQLAGAGREPRGPMGEALAELVRRLGTDP